MNNFDDDFSNGPEQTGEHVFQVEELEALERLDRFLSSRLEGQFSREKIKRCILEGQVFIGTQPCLVPKRAVLAGEVVSLFIGEASAALEPEDGELDIIYDDAHLVVLKKPHNISVHPSPGEGHGTLVNRLLARFPALARMEGERPGIVHRLDKDTTGLMLVALDEPTRLELISAFSERRVGKEYLALVYGVPELRQGRITEPLGRDSRNKTKMVVQRGGREARSDYRTLYADPTERFALLAVTIHTGRTHQIRVHLTHLGHPILGDKVYTSEAAMKKALARQGLPAPLKEFLSGLAGHQLLHAWRLHFEHPGHPGQDAMSFCAPPPPEFSSAALALSQRPMRVVLTGNPACGKSSVLKILKEQGIPVWCADEAVAGEYKAGADGWSLLRSQFGERFIPHDENGLAADVDKRALFTAMYDDDRLRRTVENIIHPIVMANMLAFWENLETLPLAEPLAVSEVPLYLESTAQTGLTPREGKEPGFAPSRPLVVGIHCPFEIRAERLRETRNWPGGMIEKIESWQWPENKKMAACDLVIDNSGSPEQLKTSVKKTLIRLEEMRAQRLRALRKILDELSACVN